MNKTKQNKTMKAALLIAAAAALGFMGCNDNDDTTQLRWENQSGNTAKDIKWVPAGGHGVISYSKTLHNDGERTEFKDIPDESRNGTGECDLGGTVGTILHDGLNSAITLSAGESATYDIKTAK